MNRILASAALALMMGTSALAQTAATMQTYDAAQPGDIQASKLIGMRVYAPETGFETLSSDTAVAAGTEKEWDDIGEVNDVVLGRDGSVKAVVLGVGGFIGIGEKDVALPMDQIKMVSEEGETDDFFLVVNASKESLEAAAEFRDADDIAMETRTEQAGETVAATADNLGEKVEEGAAATAAAAGTAATAVEQTAENAAAEVKEETAEAATAVENAAEGTNVEVQEITNAEGEKVYTNKPEETAAASTDETVEPAAEGVVVTDQAATDTQEQVVAENVSPTERPLLNAPAVERDGYAMVPATELTADMLEGARVYGANDEDIGEIGEILLSSDGSAIDRVVLDVGGFLGLGEREIAVTMDELTIMRNADGSDLRVFIDATQEALETQPEYKAAD